jgi:hypothetical protein
MDDGLRDVGEREEKLYCSAAQHDCSELFLTPVTTKPNWCNWEQWEMQKGQTIEDRHAESWGQVGWAVGWRCTTASLLLFSVILFIYFASFLYLYSLKLCF